MSNQYGALKRGPKPGRRCTFNIQADILKTALTSDKTVNQVISSLRNKGYRIPESIENNLTNLSSIELLFLVSNIKLLQTIRLNIHNTLIKKAKTNLNK